MFLPSAHLFDIREPQQRADHGCGIGDALAGDVVRAAMRDGRKQDGAPDGQCRSGARRQQLCRDMPLIVQHDHICVEPAFVKQNIGAKRPGGRNALGDCRRDRRRAD